jgi:voltage-gated potassium channel
MNAPGHFQRARQRIRHIVAASPNLFLVLRGLASLVVVATAAVSLLVHFEQMRPFDAFYLVMITLTTVGYGEVKPEGLDTTGRVIVMVVILYGISFLAYTSATLVKVIVEGEVRKLMGRRKLDKEIEKLHDHYIVCGFGRVGQVVCRELDERGVKFVVVESATGVTTKLDEAGYLYIHGDATDDALLTTVGVQRARGLVTALSSDAENVYITLTAKGLNPNLYIVASATDEAAERKVERAGAARVISPYTTSGLRVAQALLKPTVVEFIEKATTGRNDELQIEEHPIAEDSKLVGQSLKDIGMRESYNLIPVAVKRNGARMIFNPPLELILEAGDILVTMGEFGNLQAFSKIAARRPMFDLERL